MSRPPASTRGLKPGGIPPTAHPPAVASSREYAWIETESMISGMQPLMSRPPASTRGLKRLLRAFPESFQGRVLPRVRVD